MHPTSLLGALSKRDYNLPTPKISSLGLGGGPSGKPLGLGTSSSGSKGTNLCSNNVVSFLNGADFWIWFALQTRNNNNNNSINEITLISRNF